MFESGNSTKLFSEQLKHEKYKILPILKSCIISTQILTRTRMCIILLFVCFLNMLFVFCLAVIVKMI